VVPQKFNIEGLKLNHKQTKTTIFVMFACFYACRVFFHFVLYFPLISCSPANNLLKAFHSRYTRLGAGVVLIALASGKE